MKTRFATTLLILAAAFSPGAQAADKGKKKGTDKAAASKTEPQCKANETICKTIAATRQLLAGYRQAILGQIDRMEHGYSAVGQAAEQGRRAEVESILRTGRLRQAELMTDDFIHRSRPIWHWKEYLLDYAAQDLKANRELLELDSLDGSRFLGGLQNLKGEFDKVQALDKLLDALNQKKSLIDNLKDLGGIAQDTKTEFDKLVCAGLKQDLADKKTAKAAADAAKDTAKSAALDLAIKAITKERTDKSCKD